MFSETRMIVLLMLNNVQLYVHSSRQNTGMWRTHRQTDGNGLAITADVDAL